MSNTPQPDAAKMTPTLRTDAAELSHESWPLNDKVPSDFARTLERELTALQARCAELAGRLAIELTTRTDLEREAADLRRDKERLDWLSENPVQEIWFGWHPQSIVFNGETFASLRSALDSALLATKEPDNK